MASLLIENATVVLPDEIEKTSVLVRDGKIAAIDPAATATADETIDAAGLHLLPGIIDAHVHFRDPGLTHKEDLRTGSMACAKGGVTTFFEMPNTNPATTSVTRLEEKLAIAAQKCVVNYGFYLGATPNNIKDLKAATRTPGIKIFIGSSTGDLLVDRQEDLERIFAETTLPICAHCEDEDTVRANAERLGGGSVHADHSRIRNREAAHIATRRAIDLSRRHKHRFHVLHISTAEEADMLAEGEGYVTGEVCPHHLYFNVDDYAEMGSRVQMNPAVKTREDNEALWKALADGRIPMTATDHAPHTMEEKAQPYPKSPSGLPATENLLPLMLDAVNNGRLTLRRAVDAMTKEPARIWNMANKGRIDVGYDADLVLVDLNRRRKVLDEEQVTKCGWSPWHGRTLQGWPVATFVHGECVYRYGTFNTTVRGREVTFSF